MGGVGIVAEEGVKEGRRGPRVSANVSRLFGAKGVRARLRLVANTLPRKELRLRRGAFATRPRHPAGNRLIGLLRATVSDCLGA